MSRINDSDPRPSAACRPSRAPRVPRFHYAWLIAAVTFLILMLTAAIRATPAVLIVPLEREFGWSRVAISTVVSFNLLLYGLVGPFAAGLFERYGVRKVVIAAVSLLLVACACSPLISRLWQLGACWGLLVGTGTGVTAIVLGATVVHRWFYRHRGIVLGVLTASTATGQLLFLPLLAQITQTGGWRYAVLSLAAALAVLLPLVWTLMRNDPREIGLALLGAPGPEALEPAPVRANPFKETCNALADGLRSKPFWFLAGSFFVCGASTNGLIGTHLIPACVDHGIPEVRAAGLLALMGLCDLIGTTASGWLTDRVQSRWLLFWYYGLRGFSLMLLPFSFDPMSGRLPVFAVFYGLDWIATVPPTVALTAEFFGRQRVGLMFGWIVAFHQLGASLEAAFGGWIRTAQGSYDVAFFLSGLLCVLTAVAMPFLDPRNDNVTATDTVSGGAAAASEPG
ncbi:MAG: MFS transporter [Verrucomicrobia bacterium]|nr:MFS transporter [Verrucomicrobiota bacterium]